MVSSRVRWAKNSDVVLHPLSDVRQLGLAHQVQAAHARCAQKASSAQQRRLQIHYHHELSSRSWARQRRRSGRLPRSWALLRANVASPRHRRNKVQNAKRHQQQGRHECCGQLKLTLLVALWSRMGQGRNCPARDVCSAHVLAQELQKKDSRAIRSPRPMHNCWNYCARCAPSEMAFMSFTGPHSERTW